MWKSGCKVAAALCAMALVAGCASSEMGRNFDTAPLATFQKEQTTFQAAVDALGPPTQSQRTAKGNWLHQWGYVKAEAAFSQAKVTADKSMVLVFGPDDKLLGLIQYKGFTLSEAERGRLQAVPQ